MPKIDCKFLNQKTKTLVNADGSVWPCCYLGCHNYDTGPVYANDHITNQHLFKEYRKTEDKQNLNNHSLKEILNGEWFTKTLPESWKDEKTCARQCKTWCTKGNDPAETRKVK